MLLISLIPLVLHLVICSLVYAVSLSAKLWRLRPLLPLFMSKSEMGALEPARKMITENWNELAMSSGRGDRKGMKGWKLLSRGHAYFLTFPLLGPPIFCFLEYNSEKNILKSTDDTCMTG